MYQVANKFDPFRHGGDNKSDCYSDNTGYPPERYFLQAAEIDYTTYCVKNCDKEDNAPDEVCDPPADVRERHYHKADKLNDSGYCEANEFQYDFERDK